MAIVKSFRVKQENGFWASDNTFTLQFAPLPEKCPSDSNGDGGFFCVSLLLTTNERPRQRPSFSSRPPVRFRVLFFVVRPNPLRGNTRPVYDPRTGVSIRPGRSSSGLRCRTSAFRTDNGAVQQ